MASIRIVHNYRIELPGRYKRITKCMGQFKCCELRRCHMEQFGIYDLGQISHATFHTKPFNQTQFGNVQIPKWGSKSVSEMGSFVALTEIHSSLLE